MVNNLFRCLAVLLILLLAPICMAATSQNLVGLKDIQEHWARQHIEKIYATGLITGYPDNTFQPNQQVSYLEAITMILNSGGYKDQIAKIKRAKNAWPSAYPVPWGQNYMDYAVEQKFIPLTILKNFQYDRPINRAEVAAIMSKVFYFSDHGFTANFTDSNNIPMEYLTAVQTVNNNKIMSGYPDGSFQPQKPILRGEIAAIMAHVYDQGWTKEDSKRKIKGWVSNIYRDKNELKLIINSLNGTVTLATAPDCPCYYQGKKVNITQSVNFRVAGILSSNKKIMYLEMLEKRKFAATESTFYASFNNLAAGEPVIMMIKNMLNDEVSYPVTWDLTVIDEKSKNKNQSAIDIFKQLKADQFLKIGLTAEKEIKSITLLDVKTVSGTVKSVGRELTLVHKISTSSSKSKSTNYKPHSFFYWDNSRLVDEDGDDANVKVGNIVTIYYIGEPLYEHVLEIRVKKTK